MKLPDFTPSIDLAAMLNAFVRWVRSVRSILSASEVGIRWADQIHPLALMRYDGDVAPYDVATGAKSRPLAVLCLAATQRADQATTESGARVIWAWRGGETGMIRVSSIDLSSTTAEYDVTLGVLMG